LAGTSVTSDCMGPIFVDVEEERMKKKWKKNGRNKHYKRKKQIQQFQKCNKNMKYHEKVKINITE
jgi:hypothetical protein